MLHPAVVPAIRAGGIQGLLYVAWLTDDLAYGRLLARLWDTPEDLCVVEQDVEVRPGTLAEFEACPERWCSAPYPVAGDLVDGIGCVRWRHPRPFPALAPVTWANVESAYVTELHRHGMTPHHHPEVTHHHSY
jgi:hypothetical protein